MPSPAPGPQQRGHCNASADALPAGYSPDVTGNLGELEPARAGFAGGQVLAGRARRGRQGAGVRAGPRHRAAQASAETNAPGVPGRAADASGSVPGRDPHSRRGRTRTERGNGKVAISGGQRRRVHQGARRAPTPGRARAGEPGRG
ncbi:MAG: hypothetical protein ACRDOI_31785 [Trebonia sp.]